MYNVRYPGYSDDHAAGRTLVESADGHSGQILRAGYRLWFVAAGWDCFCWLNSHQDVIQSV